MSKDSTKQTLQNVPSTGLLRVKQILRFVPVSRSSWWAGVKAGKYPRPFKLGPRTTVWRVSEIRTLIDGEWKHRKTGGDYEAK